MEIAFGPCGRRTRFTGYCFSLDMATALGQRPKGLWSLPLAPTGGEHVSCSKQREYNLFLFNANCRE